MIRLVHRLLAIFSVGNERIAIHRFKAACNAHTPNQSMARQGLTKPIRSQNYMHTDADSVDSPSA